MNVSILKKVSSIPYGLFHYSEKEIKNDQKVGSMSINVMPLVIPALSPDTKQASVKTARLIFGYMRDGDFDDVWQLGVRDFSVSDICSIKVVKGGEKLLGYPQTRLDCLIETQSGDSNGGSDTPVEKRQHLLCIRFGNVLRPPFIEILTLNKTVELGRFNEAVALTDFDRRTSFNEIALK